MVPPLLDRTLAANQRDLSTGLHDILLDGLLASAKTEQRQLIGDPNVADAVTTMRQVLLHVIQYNLDVIQNIALMPERCALASLQQSRLAIEGARDAAIDCLDAWRTHQQNEVYTKCLQNIYSAAQIEIDSLKPSINACLQVLATNVTSEQ